MMSTKGAFCAVLIAAAPIIASAGERSIVSLKDFCSTEVKSAGIEVRQPTAFHVKALGGGGDYGWTYRSDRMFAYGWIINADSRALIWKMTVDNTSRSRDDREFDGTVTLEPGSYEVYFSVAEFFYNTAFTHMSVNVDHRHTPLFGSSNRSSRGWFSWLKSFWSDDITKEWEGRCAKWGIELLTDESAASSVASFTPPKIPPHIVLRQVGVGDNACLRQGFSLSAPTSLTIYAVGEGRMGKEMMDYGWIVDLGDRHRVWEMNGRNVSPAGGAAKNVQFSGSMSLKEGEYALYWASDANHSAADWNEEPPYDPLNWGVTISVESEKEKKNVRPFPYKEDQNVIASITRVHDNANRSEGFTLKEDCRVRIYAIGERSNSRRLMADYGSLMDAKTRNKVWTMDVERTSHAGGASKNRLVDEIIDLPKGSYIVTYVTDDSHSYGNWNDDPPCDQDHYGITLMGVGERFDGSLVTKYVEEGDKSIVAQIIRVGNDEDRTERFSLDRTTRIRVYAIGEGQNREMYDYGWIEDAKSGLVVWEMTYGMTFHAGGGRKNRSVNTTLLLEKGDYRLRYRSDDSHSYGDWNTDPPDDQQYWGITVYCDEVPVRPEIPQVPAVPHGVSKPRE